MEDTVINVKSEFQVINEQMRNEKSRTVKIFLLKYKCILIFTLLALTLGQFTYIIVDKLSKDGDLTSSINNLVTSVSDLLPLVSNSINKTI